MRILFVLAAFWMIVMYIADRIYRVIQQARGADNNLYEAPTSAPFAAGRKTELPEIPEAVRILTEGEQDYQL